MVVVAISTGRSAWKENRVKEKGVVEYMLVRKGCHATISAERDSALELENGSNQESDGRGALMLGLMIQVKAEVAVKKSSGGLCERKPRRQRLI